MIQIRMAQMNKKVPYIIYTEAYTHIILTKPAEDTEDRTLTINNEEEKEKGSAGAAANNSGDPKSSTTAFSMNINYSILFL